MRRRRGDCRKLGHGHCTDTHFASPAPRIGYKIRIDIAIKTIFAWIIIEIDRFGRVCLPHSLPILGALCAWVG